MISIYADGACSGNNVAGGGRAGAAAIAFRTSSAGTHELTRCQMSLGAGTNQTAELAAAHLAFDIIDKLTTDEGIPRLPFTIFCDSEYVVKGVNEWMAGWERNGWRTASKKPVANVEYWQALKARHDRLKASGVSFSFQWVKGHVTNQFNNFVDELAVAAVRMPLTDKPMPPPVDSHDGMRIEVKKATPQLAVASPIAGISAERFSEITTAMLMAGRSVVGDGEGAELVEAGILRAIQELKRQLQIA